LILIRNRFSIKRKAGSRERFVVSKQCLQCGKYFPGDLDGNYLCPACAERGALRPRTLYSLDDLVPPSSPGPGRDAAPGAAKGHAA